MSKRLVELLQVQANFDLSHEGRKPFFEHLSDANPEALEHLVVCVAGEVGELANIAKKIRRGDFLFSDKKPEIGAELADIFAYVLKIANQAGLDLEQAYLQKVEKNEVRFEGYKK